MGNVDFTEFCRRSSVLTKFSFCFAGHSDQSSSVTLQKLKNCLKWSLVDFYEFFGQKGEEKKKKYKEKLKKKKFVGLPGIEPASIYSQVNHSTN